ncbi:MAG: GWxTD domain-containing protein [Bacteroidia bacterium]|nr:GWxTD domain-containing protein [Bacteroidia bacterium]
MIRMTYRKEIARFTLAILICFSSSAKLWAQWTLQVKNLQGEKFNTRLFLGYNPNNSDPKKFLADISLRPQELDASYIKKRVLIRGKRPSSRLYVLDDNQYVGDYHLDPNILPPVFMRKELEFETRGEKIFYVDLELPEDQLFTIDVDIKDKDSEEHQLLTLEEPYLVHSKIRLQTSDLFLGESQDETSLTKKPFLAKVVKVDQAHLHYGIYLYAKDYELLRIRAILAKENPNTEIPSTQVFESIQQSQLVVNPQGRKSVLFSDTLDLRGLEASTYTIWVLVEAGGDKKMERVSFIKGSDISKRIYDKLDESIEMMAYITSKDKITEMNSEEVAGIKLNKFNKIWEGLYGDDAQGEMQLYYEKIFWAETNLQEGNTPGWKTDRGKTYVLYGPPTDEEYVTIRGKEYLRWIYPRWSLSFLFENLGEEWKLREK